MLRINTMQAVYRGTIGIGINAEHSPQNRRSYPYSVYAYPWRPDLIFPGRLARRSPRRPAQGWGCGHTVAFCDQLFAYDFQKSHLRSSYELGNMSNII